MVTVSVALSRLTHSHVKPGKLAAFCLASVAILWLTGSASGAITIDGRFDPTEGYTTGYYVNFTLEDDPGTIHTGAELWMHQVQDPDPNLRHLSLALLFPKTLCDNSYGTTAIGWGGDAPSGKNHKFQDLTGSDKAGDANDLLAFKDGSGTVELGIVMDYLHGFGLKLDGKPDKNLPPFRSGGVTDGEGYVPPANASDVLAAETSMGYNYATYGLSHPAHFGKDSNSPAADADYGNPDLADWVYEITYELQIAGSVIGDGFDPSNADWFEIGVVHMSPNKLGRNKVYPKVDGAIPEPSSVLVWVLLGVSSGGVGWWRRRR